MNKLDSKKKLFTQLFILIFVLALLSKYVSIDYTLANVVITGFLLYATYEYAQLTEELVSETNKMRKAQTQPNVYAAVQPVDELNEIMEFFIQNLGSGAAYNIKFVDPPVFRYAEKSFLSNVHLIKNGIEFLAPRQKMHVFMMLSYQVFELNSKDPINIKIKYIDIEGEEIESNYKIDFSIVLDVQRMKDRYTSFESNLLDNAKEINKSLLNLKNISSNVESIANSSIDSTGIMQSDSCKLLFTTEDYKAQVEIAKSLVKKALLKFYYELKTCSQSNSRIANSTLQVYSSNFIDIAVSATGLLPDKLIEDLLSLVVETNLFNKKINNKDYLEWVEEVKNNILDMYDNFDKYFGDHIE